MIPLIADHTDELAELCRRHYVKRLEVFGSAAVGDFNPKPATIDTYAPRSIFLGLES